jgi:hypothetical protein
VLKAKKKHSVKVRDGGRCVYCGSFYDLTIRASTQRVDPRLGQAHRRRRMIASTRKDER